MGILSHLLNAGNKLFADDPTQYVESDDESLATVSAVAIKEGKLSKDDAVTLLGSFKKFKGISEAFQTKVENAIRLLPSDKSDFRDDSTVEKVKATNIDSKPAGELENHQRARGGRARDDRSK